MTQTYEGLFFYILFKSGVSERKDKKFWAATARDSRLGGT